MVPCTWLAPSRTPAIEFATPHSASLWQWIPMRTPDGPSSAITSRIASWIDGGSVLERVALQEREELELLGVGGREAGLDDVDAELVEPMDDTQLLPGRQRHALALHAVAERGVVELDLGRCHGGPFVQEGRIPAAASVSAEPRR